MGLTDEELLALPSTSGCKHPGARITGQFPAGEPVQTWDVSADGIQVREGLRTEPLNVWGCSRCGAWWGTYGESAPGISGNPDKGFDGVRDA
jgi:hypothetical protein